MGQLTKVGCGGEEREAVERAIFIDGVPRPGETDDPRRESRKGRRGRGQTVKVGVKTVSLSVGDYERRWLVRTAKPQ